MPLTPPDSEIMASQPLSNDKKNSAQTALVNTSLRVGMQMLYDRVDSAGATTPEEAMAQLLKIADDNERIVAFDRIARDNGLDLEFKSNGAKSAARAAEKAAERKIEQHELSDHVRLSVFSGKLELINEYAERLHAQAGGNMEPWHLKRSGALLKVLKCRVQGINGEVQFLPRQQARLATRITHHFFKILREYDALEKQEHPDPQRLASVIERYNAVAHAVNELASTATLDQPAMRNALNTLFSSDDFSGLALDEKTEGVNRKPTADYSPIFKTNEDIQDYRIFFQTMGQKLKLVPMPQVAADAPIEDLMAPMMKLLQCSQITYAGYMQEAPEDLRNLWVSLAYELNHEHTVIPTRLVNTVPHDVNQVGGRDGRAL
jgi:hypothetical protein